MTSIGLPIMIPMKATTITLKKIFQRIPRHGFPVRDGPVRGPDVSLGMRNLRNIIARAIP